MNLTDIEQNLRKEETALIQEKVRTRAYVEEVSEIAIKILVERGAVVPEVETDEEEEAKYAGNNKVSLIAFLLFASYILVLYFGNITFSRFVIFTAIFIVTLTYTFKKKKK